MLAPLLDAVKPVAVPDAKDAVHVNVASALLAVMV